MYTYMYMMYLTSSLLQELQTLFVILQIHVFAHSTRTCFTIRNKQSQKYLPKQLKKLKALLLLGYNAANIPPYLTRF